VERGPQGGGAIRAGGNREAEVHFSDLDCKANSNSTPSSISRSNSKPKAPVEETGSARLSSRRAGLARGICFFLTLAEKQIHRAARFTGNLLRERDDNESALP
jgi:hypothetical protein